METVGKGKLHFLSDFFVLRKCAGNIPPAVLPTSLNGMDEGMIEIVKFGKVNPDPKLISQGNLP